MQLRVARHTNKLDQIIEFYTHLFSLEILGRFNQHNGYDGVFLGLMNKDWHLEFTTTFEEVNHYPDEDDCIVFYPESRNEYDNIIRRINDLRIEIIQSKNPYWNENGITIKDPDGFYVITSTTRIK